MSEETQELDTNEQAVDNDFEEGEEEQEEKKEELVMCYISKRMVPMSHTTEVVYSATKKYRVLPEFIRY